MDFEDKYYIAGIDGGATTSTAVLLDDSGKTLATHTGDGISLTVYQEESPERVRNLLYRVSKTAGVSPLDIDSIGLGLAGSSNENGRDLVFRHMEKEGFTRSILVTSDVEAAYEIGCPTDPGFLISVGTGIICMTRTQDGAVHRTAGLGHDQGDKGSGYWIGQQALMTVALGEAHVYTWEDVEELKQSIVTGFEADSFDTAVEDVMSSDDKITRIASLADRICALAVNGNELALAIIQEATSAVADYINELVHLSGYTGKHLVLAGNGSLLKNDLYRSSLNDALRFDFPDVKWLFSRLSPAYGAAILAGRLVDIELSLKDVVNNQ